MQAVLRGILAAGGIVFVALTASCQTSTGTVTGRVTGTIGTGAGHARQPYTAHFRIVTEQTLANGTMITHESTEIQARDSQGRQFFSTTTPLGGNKAERTTVYINDPVARMRTNWSSLAKMATVRPMPPPATPGQERVCWSTNPAASATALTREEVNALALENATVDAAKQKQPVSREDLGTQTIQGVVATGARTTRTIPAGDEGNDAPLVITDEVWQSKALGIVVQTVTDDPRTGKQTRELVALEQSEPDPALFQPPADFKIVTHELHQVACPQ
jgi:hypothetical protein